MQWGWVYTETSWWSSREVYKQSLDGGKKWAEINKSDYYNKYILNQILAY